MIDMQRKNQTHLMDGDWCCFFRSICWLVTKHKKVMFLATLETGPFSTAALTCIGTDFFSGKFVGPLPNVKMK